MDSQWTEKEGDLTEKQGFKQGRIKELLMKSRRFVHSLEIENQELTCEQESAGLGREREKTRL